MTLEYNCDEEKYNDILNTINGYISDSSPFNSDCEYIDYSLYNDEQMYNNAEFIDSDGELENIINKSNKNLEDNHEKEENSAKSGLKYMARAK